jgi:4-amino-4-deoxy-L-arabinose transferase-like glycosyltransferase
MTQRKSEFGLSGNSIIGAIVMVVALVAIWILAGFIIGLLYKWALLLLIPTAIIDHKVITGYFKWLMRLARKNIGTGLAAIVLSAIGYPFVTLFLFGKALFKRKIKQVEKEVKKQKEGEFVEYEELPEEAPLELPEIKTPQKETSKGDYENLFDE